MVKKVEGKCAAEKARSLAKKQIPYLALGSKTALMETHNRGTLSLFLPGQIFLRFTTLHNLRHLIM
jgi:hypothetical protein